MIDILPAQKHRDSEMTAEPRMFPVGARGYIPRPRSAVSLAYSKIIPFKSICFRGSPAIMPRPCPSERKRRHVPSGEAQELSNDHNEHSDGAPAAAPKQCPKQGGHPRDGGATENQQLGPHRRPRLTSASRSALDLTRQAIGLHFGTQALTGSLSPCGVTAISNSLSASRWGRRTLHG